MRWIKMPQDNFFLGLIAGIASLALSYILLRSVRMIFVAHYDNPYFFPPPRVEFISILINIIFFRIVIVNWNRDKTGRGILFSTVLLSIAFFFLFYKFNFRLP